MFARVWVLVLLACAQTQGAELYLPSSYVVPGGEGSGDWGEWGTVSSCSRTCGGGVASQKRICLEVGPDGRPACMGGDTKYFFCQTQDCPEGSVDFRQEQCSKHNHEDFRGSRYTWKSYTSGNPCELTCKPDGQRFYYRFSEKVIDGTRCNEESYDVCVDGVCQPVGCDMMLGSSAREDKCLECRGNNTNCRTYEGQIAPKTELRQGYNDVLLIPAGATSIYIEEVKDSNNYLALRSKINNKYYLNGDYMIDFSGILMIAGAAWHYERTQQGFASPDKLRCQGPTNEPLYLSLLLQEDNVGIKYEYSLPTSVAPPPNQQYIWVHDDYTPCSATCGGGFQIRTVTCRSHEELKTVDDSLCDDGLKPVSNQTCNTESCSARWVEGPWSACSKPCGEGGSRSRTVHCEKNIDRYPAIVDDRECFELLGPKPALFQECSNNASYSKWFTGPWKPCDKLCGEGKKTRQVVCYQKDEKGRIEKLSDENCADEKPPTDEPCELHPCDGVDWITSDWSGCDSCTSRVRTRNALCATKDRVVNDTLCGQRPRPVLEEPCDRTNLPACGALWYATQWSECSAECGRGVHTRKVFCGLFDGSSIMKVDDARCKKEHKYSDTKPCEIPIEKCPAKWFTSPWGMCDMMCDGGYQARKTMCIVGTKVTADACDLTTLPELVQPCNTFSCDKDEISTTIKNDEHEEYDDSRRHTLTCHHSGFGCCPDNKTAAMGPFQNGCLIPKTCNETVYGCCPDGVSPATGPKSEGCPSIPCNETMFGCFMADNETSAEVNDRESGPSPPPPCKSAKYGCCKDGQTQSTGPGTESARGAQMEGCVMSCNNSAYGCCPDGETPAHGEQNEGCCLQSPFGCCPDNYKPAEGPLMEGCGCQFAHYGCCPDNVTIARGPNNDGCGCQYTQFGCCPDRHTEASGPDYEGCDCHTYQFGCCPDGSTIAKSPSLQGCHCQQSKYGCCGDKQTAATGPNQAGCDCSTSEYGCCPDGQTEAKGKKFLGCTDLPENRQEACSLPTDRGSCRNYTSYWYYDITYGGCFRFWYGGCEGNGNRFSSKEECEDVCVQPSPKDTCKLPKVKGECEGYHLRWYYDSHQEKCNEFVYGGCLGNTNNFESRELCQEQCEPTRSEDTCKEPIDRGLCAGNFGRWGYNSETRRCEQFIWGGCEGNGNRFSSEAACIMRCDAPGVLKPECLEPQELGNCTEKFATWSFSQTENRCMPFYYTGCGGNGNRFESEQSCTESCPSAYDSNDNEVLPDCSTYVEDCRNIACTTSVQRTRTEDGCERCSCAPAETNCEPSQQECDNLRCDFGMDTTIGEDGCQRCRCKDHLCASKECPSGERCLLNRFRDPLSHKPAYVAECRTTNKPGVCPAQQSEPSSGLCGRECYDDADCRGVGKCCAVGCSKLCFESVPVRTRIVLARPSLLPGEELSIPCEVDGYPIPDVHWTKDGARLSADSRMQVTDARLTIQSVAEADSGEYSCHARNQYSDHSSSVDVSVRDPVETAARISGDMNDTVIGELNKSLTIRCLAYGYPEPAIFWYRGIRGPMVPYSSSLYEARGNVLQIRRLTPETVGEYACQAYNGIDKAATWTITVQAYSSDGHESGPYIVARNREVVVTPRQPQTQPATMPPEIDVPVYQVPVRTRIVLARPSLLPGEELSIPCEVDGYPIPDVHWTKDGARLSADSRMQVTDAQLTIQSVAEADSGEYSCHARNQYSDHSSSVDVSVREVYVPEKCEDNPFFADCQLLVRSKYCTHRYYSKFCCRSCVLAGQLDPANLDPSALTSAGYRAKTIDL